jgi:HAD superfamily hydrolase (TIGR01457 family)
MLKNHKLFLFDMDGTLYIGGQLFDFTKELLARIRQKGCRYLFVTNNSSKSVDAYIDKLANFGIRVTEDDFVTSSQATSYYLSKHHPGRKLYVCGTESLKKELIKGGFEITEDLEQVECIVMGYDTELTYRKLEDVCKLLFTREDIPYIATHPDYKCITEFGSVPDIGAMCEMIWRATGKKPVIVGKPQPLIPELAMKKCGCTKEETVFVGDQMDTDIPCGLNAGVTTLLVMTGETTQEMVDAAPRKPTKVLKNAGEILNMI